MLKKAAAILLILVMTASLAACGNSGSGNVANNGGDSQSGTVVSGNEDDIQVEITHTTTREITVGTWYDQYYTSDHDDIYDNPSVANVEQAQMQLDNMRAIEEKYNVKFRFVNLTWAGDIESINTSIMAGQPDCDIYLVDLSFGIPAVLNGYAMPIEEYASASSDIFNDQKVMRYLNLMGEENNYLFAPASITLDSYPLGFNMAMLEEAGLENPQDLYDRGEWTWDKFREYLLALTVDENNDGVTDVYGLGTVFTQLFSNLMMSNGTGMANGTTEGISSPATIEVLDFMYNMYNVDKVARPWDPDDFWGNNNCFADGLTAFWAAPGWIMSDYTVDELGFEFGIVPWPIGPSGNQETNATYKTAGNWYIIPVGVDNPALVYQVMFDWSNWYNYDTDYRDSDLTWWEDAMYSERNFDYLKMMGEKQTLDIWESLSFPNSEFNLQMLIEGSYTPSQMAEQTKNVLQSLIDEAFGQ